MDDREIVEGLFERSESAVSEAADKYGDRLRRLAMSFLDSEQDAEECLNDALLKTWRSIPPNKPDNLFAYMARIVRCTAFDMLDAKKAAKRSAVVVELTNELAECIPDRLSDTEPNDDLGELLDEFVSSLSFDKRRLFVGRYWYGLSIEELCRKTGFSQSKVKSSLMRTRRELCKFLDRKGVSL